VPTILKLRRRLGRVVASAANTMVVPLLSPIVALIVVRMASAELWGQFVAAGIIAQLGAHVVGWGNKEYLLRQFGQRPAALAQAWQTGLASRAALFGGYCVVVVLLGLPALQAALLMAWCLGLALDQSFEALVVFKQAFAFATLVDLLVLALTVAAAVLIGGRLTLEWLLAIFAAASLASAALLALRFWRQSWPAGAGRFDPGYFRAALPFFLLGLSGMLQSRADLYVVTALLPRGELAHYQVLTNLLIYLQTGAYLLLAPFLRSVYRLPAGALARLSMNLFVVGLVVLAPAMALVGQVTAGLYHFAASPALLVVGGLVVLPSFFYLPIIYRLYREQRQALVLATNVLGIATSLALSLLLVPAFGLQGALAANAAAQWLMLCVYLWRRRSPDEVRSDVVSQLS
jgi:O-antigen/teichoic acid export membrane protein